MKGIRITLFSIAILLGFSACSFGVPKKISVVSDAEYNFCVGNINKSLDDQFDVDRLFDDSSLGDIKLYDYFPGKKDAKTKQFLTKIPFQEIPIDVSAFFSNSDLAEDIANLSFEKSVEIPDFKLNYTKSINNDTLNETIGALLTIVGKSSTGVINFSDESVFDRVVFESGTLIITCPEITDNSEVSLSNGGKTFSANFSSDGKAEIDFENFTFQREGTNLNFSGPHGKDYVAVVSNNSKVKEVFGVTIQTPVTSPSPINFKIPLEDSTNTLQYCIINKGALTTNLKIPSSWSGYTISYEINSSGAVNFSSPKTNGNSKRIDLSGKTITPGELDVNFNFYLTFNNAYLDLSKEVNIVVDTELNSFSEISISSEYANQNINSSDDFTDEVLNFIKEIMLNSSGISGTYTNTFPPDNDISVLVNSDFLGIENKSEILKSNVTNKKFSIKSQDGIQKQIKLTSTPVAENEYKGWDFNINMELPGYTSTKPNIIVLKNVVPGKKYDLSINIKTEIDWEYIIINAQDTRQNSVISLGLDTGSLLQNMNDTIGTSVTDKINFYSLPLYLMAEKPVIKGSNKNIFDDAKFSGHIKLIYGKKDGSGTVTTLTDGAGNNFESVIVDTTAPGGKPISFVDAPEIIMEKKTVVTDLKNIEKSIDTDLSSLLNATKARTDGELFLDYDLTFSNGDNNDEIKITKDMLDIDDNAISIRVYAYLVFPLKFKVSDTSDLEIDILSMFSDQTGQDILSRDGPTDLGDLDDYLSVIEKCSVVYDINHLPFNSQPALELRLDFFNDGNLDVYTAESGTFDMRYEQIKNMFQTYPFIPSASLALNKGTIFSLPREISIDMNLSIRLKTNGEINLVGGNN